MVGCSALWYKCDLVGDEFQWCVSNAPAMGCDDCPIFGRPWLSLDCKSGDVCMVQDKHGMCGLIVWFGKGVTLSLLSFTTRWLPPHKR